MPTLCQLELLFAKFDRNKCRNILQNRMFRVFRPVWMQQNARLPPFAIDAIAGMV